MTTYKEYSKKSDIVQKQKKDRINKLQREYRAKERLAVITYYSNGHKSCYCCLEKRYEFLCIDHINGGGGKHLKSIGGNFYKWLIRNKFPKGYRVLCHNCNMARGFYGYCPHEKEREFYG